MSASATVRVRLKPVLRVALASFLMATGSAKLAYLYYDPVVPTLLRDYGFAWRSLLIVFGGIEVFLGVLLLLGIAVGRLYQLNVALFAVYGLSLTIAEIVSPRFASACGCLGPQLSLGFLQHLALTGLVMVLLLVAASLERSGKSNISV